MKEKKTPKKGNIFSKILSGDIPCKKVYESKTSLAFYDINPQAPIHVLAIPKKACFSIFDFVQISSSYEVKEFFQDISKVVEILNLKESGCKLISNYGKDGGQEIDYFHVHILGGQKI